MTTPERLRRRQIRESVGIAALAFGLVGAVVYFEGQDDAQRACITSYIESQSETSTIRSGLVEDESKATRDLLLRGTTAESREEFARVRAQYVKRIKAIDAARAANPVRQFPTGVCD